MSVALLALAGALWAQAAEPAPTAALAQVEHHLAQAELFARRGWTADAAAELEAALALPGGAERYAVHWQMAQVQWALYDAARCLEHAAAAAALARGDTELTQAADLVDWLRQGFGVVVLRAPQPGLRSRLQLTPTTPVLDPELARFVDGVALRWTSPQELPLRVMLPAGEYTVQGRAITVTPGQERTLELALGELGAGGFAALQVSRLELGIGVGLWLGEATANQRPALELQAGFTQPVGPWLLGLTGDLAWRSWTTRPGVEVRALGGASLGARVGRELQVAGPLSLRPALGYRALRLPGVLLRCDGDCAPAWEGAGGPALVSATSWVHLPYAELSVDWRQAGRSTATGLGVRVQGGWGLGRLPAQGEAALPDGGLYPFTVEDRGWGTPWVRLMSEVSFAF